MLNLSSEDFDVIIESLKYFKSNIENYGDYPSPQFKKDKILNIENLINRIQTMKKGL